MSDLKQIFSNWLKDKGCLEKTGKGRPSTVYEYIKRIDRLCDKLYDNHTSKEWEILATNINSVLVSHYESCNREYYINKYNLKKALQYFNDIGKICSNSDYPQANLNFVYKENSDFLLSVKICQIEDYLRIFDFVLDTKHSEKNLDEVLGLYLLYNAGSSEQIKKFRDICSQKQCLSFSDISLHILYDKDNTKTKAALMQYYEFLQVSSDSPVIARLKDQRDDDKIKLYIAKVDAAFDDLMKCLTDIPKTGKTALQIKSHFPNGYLPKLEVASVLEIDHKTLNTLEDKGILTPNKLKGFYDEQDINEYLEKHFHKAKNHYPEVDYSKEYEVCGNKKCEIWCNRRKAAKIMKCTERTIYNYTKNGLLTYTDYAPQAPRYYKPELEYLAINK